jgi:hypothetical protein
MQHILKSALRTAWAQIITTELLAEFNIAMNNANASLDVRFGWERLPPLTRDFESKGGFQDCDACA